MYSCRLMILANRHRIRGIVEHQGFRISDCDFGILNLNGEPRQKYIKSSISFFNMASSTSKCLTFDPGLCCDFY